MAEQLGLRQDRLVLLIHSGSRGLGDRHISSTHSRVALHPHAHTALRSSGGAILGWHAHRHGTAGIHEGSSDAEAYLRMHNQGAFAERRALLLLVVHGHS